MIRHTLSALLAATGIAIPAAAQTQPVKPPSPPQPAPRVVIEQHRDVEREKMRTAQRDNNRVEQTERVSHTFKIGGNGELQVANWIGDITISRRGGNEVRVEAVQTGRGPTQ